MQDIAITVTDVAEGGGTLNGTNRPNLIVGTNAPDTINGRGGSDTIYGYQGDGISGVDGSATPPTIDISPATDNDSINAGNGNDLVFSGNGDDALDGGNGRDTLNGGVGDDILSGNSGNDTFAFGQGFGNDVITDFGRGNNRIDLIAFSLTGIGDLTINTVAGDTLITSAATDFGQITLSSFTRTLDAGDFLLG